MAIRRRRVCEKCHRRFTTKERIEEEIRLAVIKRDGSRVPYRRDKVIAGAEKACSKLEVTTEQIEELADLVEEDLFRNHEREVTTREIGQYVARHLRRLSQVAYVRFMAVYKQFAEVEEFVEAIREVKAQSAADSPDQKSLFEA